MLNKLEHDPNFCFLEEDDGVVDDIDIDIDGEDDCDHNNGGDDDPDIEKQLALEFKALELDNMTTNEKHVTSDEYKIRAKTAMKNGKKDEALRLMKLAKEQLQIEQGISNPSSLIRSHSSRSNDSNSPRSKRYNQKPSTVPPVKATRSPPVQKATSNTSSSASSSSSSSHVSIASPLNYDPKKVSAPLTPLTPSLELSWSLLVAALEEAIDQCKNEALELGKQGKKAEAIPFMAKLKEYQKELDTAKSRLIIPGARPVLWRWQNETIQKTHENVEMGDDQIQLVIGNAVDMGLSLQPYEGCLVTCEYNLSFPKDSPIIGKAEGKVKAGVVSFQLKTLLKVTLKRGSQSLLGLFSRRSVTFTLSLQKKGFFSNTIIPLGIATMPLSSLFNKCECGGLLLLYSESEGRNRSALPGAIEAYLRLRRPIDKPVVIVTTRSTLILDDWSTANSTSTTPVTSAASPLTSEPVVSSTVPQPVVTSATPQPKVSQPLPPPPPPSQPVEAKPKPKVDFSTLTDEEKNDPFSPSIIRSNKALEQDIEEETAKLATASGDDRLNCQIRLDGLNMQMGRLISAVQDETLSIPIYIEMLQRQVERDKKLALYFSTLPCDHDADAVENKDIAIRLLKRSKVIAEELKDFENMKEDDV
jgi:hypothetical protein